MGYDQTTQIMSAPVSIYDLQRALSKGSPDLGALITQGNINKWSKWKPVRHGSVSYITGSQRNAVDHGFDLVSATMSIDALWSAIGERFKSLYLSKKSALGREPAFYELDEISQLSWEYLRPRGNTAGHPEAFRMTDFVEVSDSGSAVSDYGYKRDTPLPWLDFTQKEPMSLVVIGYSSYHYNRTGLLSVDNNAFYALSNHFRIVPGDISGYSLNGKLLSNCYTGVIYFPVYQDDGTLVGGSITDSSIPEDITYPAFVSAGANASVLGSWRTYMVLFDQSTRPTNALYESAGYGYLIPFLASAKIAYSDTTVDTSVSILPFDNCIKPCHLQVLSDTVIWESVENVITGPTGSAYFRQYGDFYLTQFGQRWDGKGELSPWLSLQPYVEDGSMSYGVCVEIVPPSVSSLSFYIESSQSGVPFVEFCINRTSGGWRTVLYQINSSGQRIREDSEWESGASANISDASHSITKFYLCNYDRLNTATNTAPTPDKQLHAYYERDNTLYQIRNIDPDGRYTSTGDYFARVASFLFTYSMLAGTAKPDYIFKINMLT